jgi:hypothetical protein
MNKLMVFPIIITVIQLISFGHLYYIHKHGSGQFPADFIELNILAICNVGVLILAYFLYFKADIKLNIWLVPILLATITILLLLVTYVIMWANKYK